MRVTPVLFLALSLAACRGKVTQVDPTDNDGDGSSSAADCDDANAAVYPGAPEICNGIDDNCDGNLDEGLETSTYYADADGDGFGDIAAPVTACGESDGVVADATASERRLLQRSGPIGRPGTAEEIARLAGFLLSDDASLITGETIVADGGYQTGPRAPSSPS